MSIKLILMLAIYILTGGALFSGQFNRVTFAIVAAGTVAIIMSIFFWRDVYQEALNIITNRVVNEIEDTRKTSPIKEKANVDEDDNIFASYLGVGGLRPTFALTPNNLESGNFQIENNKLLYNNDALERFRFRLGHIHLF